MKNIFSIICALVFGLTPAMALADDHNGMPPPPPGVIQYRESDFEEHGSSTRPMPGERGEKRGIIKHFGTTTPPGFLHRGEGSTTDEHEGSHDRGPRFDIAGLFRFIFGNGSTTLAASSTASTTPPVPPGLVRHLFDLIGNWFSR